MIGHSTRTIEDFIDILKYYDIDEVVDVRTITGSRRNPQYNAENLQKSLEKAGIIYKHIKELGGLRKAQNDSVNLGWENLSFRGYADYMQTTEFEQGLSELQMEIAKHTVAIMCAEAVPWRCHRRLIGDALLIRGYKVVDIFEKGEVRDHELTPFAKVDGCRIIYP